MGAAARAAPPGPATVPAAKPRKRRGGAAGGVWLAALGLTLAALFALPSVLLLSVASVPTVGVLLWMRRKPATAAYATGAPTVAATLPFLIDLWRAGQTMGGALRTLADPITLIVAWGGAGFGLGLYVCVPPLIAFSATVASRTRLALVEARLRQLTEEWGPEARAQAQDEPAPGKKPHASAANLR